MLALRYTRSVKLTEWNPQGSRATSEARAQINQHRSNPLSMPSACASIDHSANRYKRKFHRQQADDGSKANGTRPVSSSLFAHARPKDLRPFVPVARLQGHQSASIGRNIELGSSRIVRDQ